MPMFEERRLFKSLITRRWDHGDHLRILLTVVANRNRVMNEKLKVLRK